jgi:hypothetical protein
MRLILLLCKALVWFGSVFFFFLNFLYISPFFSVFFRGVKGGRMGEFQKQTGLISVKFVNCVVSNSYTFICIQYIFFSLYHACLF